jgi:hypothetical protein
MSELNLEQRYRRVLRLLPGYYRDKWEEDMVAAFLDSWLTGEQEDDGAILEFCKPTWQEVASVVGLAGRLYLGGAGTPRRYFAWGQAVRGAVLAVVLLHAVMALAPLTLLARRRGLIGWLPMPQTPAGIWPLVSYSVDYAWLVIVLALVFGHYRVARALTALAIIPDLVFVVQSQLAGTLRLPIGSWASWTLLDLAPVLAMAAFHRDAPPVARRRWLPLLALPAGYLLVIVPTLALDENRQFAWVPDFPGLCCILITLACLVHAPRARFGAAGSGVWSLTLILLAVVAEAFRIASLGDYLRDQHLINVGLVEMLVLVGAVALIAPDAARAAMAAPAGPVHPQPG